MRKRILIVAAAAGIGLAASSMQAAAHDEPVVGVLGGAGAGALVAGPPGAVAGAIIGAIAGATVAHDNDHGRRAHRHRHSHVYYREHREPVVYRETVAYREPVYYRTPVVNGSNGSTSYYCEPNKGYRVKTVAVAAKPKYRKVCRYVRVS